MRILSSFIIAVFVTAVSCGKQKSSDRDNILNIDDVKYFKKIIKTHTNLLVLFAETEKEASSKLELLAPLATEFKGRGSVAFLNCGEYPKVCKKYKISTRNGLVLKHYRNGKFNKDYDRKDTLRSLRSFMNDPTGDAPWEEEDGADTVRHIDSDKDFGKLIKKEKKPVFVMFYAPWCGFCKRLKPVFQEIAYEMRELVLLAGMDVDKQESMATRMTFNITGFPTLIFFKSGSELFRYKGKHDKDLLIEWLQNPSEEAPKSEEDEEWKDTPSDVVHLSDKTFDDYIANEPSVLVMFYAPWCGHCKAMKPEYVTAAETLKEENISGKLAALDATKETEIGKRFEVKGFPTVKYFKDGEFVFDVNERKADRIIEFMKDPKEPPPPPAPEPEWKDTPSDVNHLEDDNFKEFVKKKKHVLVMFYAPWCGHCKKAKPEFTEAAEHFADNKKVEFAAVDCTKEVSICGTYGVEGYPTIIYFNYGKNNVKYSGGREKADFISYMSDPENTPKPPPKEAQWSDEPSFVEHLTDQNFQKFIDDNPSVLVMFYAPWCGHCKAMKPAFMEAAEELKIKKRQGVLAAVNCMEEQGLRKKYEINGFPAVKYFKNGEYAFDYPKSRTKDDLVNFMINPSDATPATPPPEVAWSDGDNDVIHLTSTDFDQFVQKHNSVLVMFYAPCSPETYVDPTSMSWKKRNLEIANSSGLMSDKTDANHLRCGHCKKTKPGFEEAATQLNNEKESGKMAAVDCTKNTELCAKFDVKGYPTIKYFKNGEDLFKYKEARNAKSFLHFMKSPQAPEPEWSTIPGNVRHLTDDTLIEFLKDHKSVLVMFYSPQCGFCKSMKPDYIAAADQLSAEGSDIVLAAIDAMKYKKSTAEHVKTGYPTVTFFRYGEEITEYDGNRAKDDIIKFVKEMDNDDGGNNEQTGTSDDAFKFNFAQVLSQETFGSSLRENEHSLVMFYAPWCGHCKNTKPLFDEAAEKMKGENGKLVAAVDCSAEPEFCVTQEVKGYPTIKYYHFGSFVMNYEKSRTTEEFLQFLANPPSRSAHPTSGKEEL